MKKLVLIIPVLALTGCSLLPLPPFSGQGSDDYTLDGEDVQSVDTFVPSYISLDNPAPLRGIHGAELTSGYAEQGSLSVTGGGDPTLTEQDFASLGCLLTLRQGTASDEGLNFRGQEDGYNTARVLERYIDYVLPTTYQRMGWTVDGGAIDIETQSAHFVDAAGRQVFAIARGLGELDYFVLAQLSCDPGINTRSTFIDVIVPSLELEFAR